MEVKCRKIIVLDDDEKLDYIITTTEDDNEKLYELFASQSEAWCEHVRGTCLMQLRDDGNGIKLDQKYRKMDYSQAFYLNLLLNLNYLDSPNSMNHRFIDITETE